jgi:hypothetical protein
MATGWFSVRKVQAWPPICRGTDPRERLRHRTSNWLADRLATGSPSSYLMNTKHVMMIAFQLFLCSWRIVGLADRSGIMASEQPRPVADKSNRRCSEFRRRRAAIPLPLYSAGLRGQCATRTECRYNSIYAHHADVSRRNRKKPDLSQGDLAT